jgi:RecB family endonuclease NucS
LQRLLRDKADVIEKGLFVIAEEFGDWDESWRRIDLLGLDKDRRLVVIELKRDERGGAMELQAIRYAAMVSNMTFDQIVDAHSKYLAGRHIGEDAKKRILEHLEIEEAEEVSMKVKGLE